MIKHSVTSRMVGAFSIIFLSKTLGFCTMLIVLFVKNPEGVITVRKKRKKRSPQLIERKGFGSPGRIRTSNISVNSRVTNLIKSCRSWR